MDRRLLRQAGGVRVYLFTVVSLGVLAGILVISQAYSLVSVINGVFLLGKGFEQEQDWLLLLFGVILGRALLGWLTEIAAARASARARRNMREPLLAHLLKLGPRYVRGERSGELTALVVDGVESLDAYFSQYLPQLFLTILVPAIVVVAVFSADLLSGVVLLVTAPLLPVFMVLIGKLADSLTKRQWKSLSFLSAHFLDVLQGLTTLKLFGRSGFQRETIGRISEQYRSATMKVLRVAFLSALVQEVAATISTAIVAVEVGLRLLYGQMDFQPALFVLLLAPEYYMPFRALGAKFHAAMSGGTAAKRMFEVMEAPAPPEGGDPDVMALVDGRVPVQGQPFILRDVTYSYEGRSGELIDTQRPALRGVSFRIEPGQKVALVGPNGAGKSTIAHLLLRFIEPSSGNIDLGDVPMQSYPAAEWRKQISWVPQHPYLFNATVAENIRFGNPDASREDIVRAALSAYAHEFIVALPEAYNTVIGERGARLSGGQAQRIGLARAFLRNAPLLILDEATSNLDPGHEALVMQATERLMKGRTVLIIAHRLATVRNADKVIVLDGGQVVQTGKHMDLLQADGVYRRLVRAYSGYTERPADGGGGGTQ